MCFALLAHILLNKNPDSFVDWSQFDGNCFNHTYVAKCDFTCSIRKVFAWKIFVSGIFLLFLTLCIRRQRREEGRRPTSEKPKIEQSAPSKKKTEICNNWHFDWFLSQSNKRHPTQHGVGASFDLHCNTLSFLCVLKCTLYIHPVPLETLGNMS